ncbi:phage portal protein [Ectothiorhodospira mobilis]|uniref:phage portal protein n=1 Tax=Ectothiorhodospira mobilis TaxID=195064 RepID=UPI0019037112|nr:phage portal protein [Ectothiorhodospira mobilis]
MSAQVMKSVHGLELDGQAAAADERPWPVSPHALAQLYQMDPTHARACQVKAEGVAGGGLAGDDAEALADVLATEDLVSIALDLEVYGNAFVERVRDRTGKLTGLHRLPAWSMARKAGGGYRQRLWQQTREKTTNFKEKQIAMLRAPCPLGGHYSLPGYLAAEGVVQLLHAITRYNQRFFEAGAVPEHVITHSGPEMSRDQQAAIRDFFTRELRGVENSRKTLFLSLPEGQEINFQAVSQDGDGKFLDLMKMARDLLPTAHGVPPRLLGIVASGQLGGSGEMTGQMQAFETFSLAPRRRLLNNWLRDVATELGARPDEVALQGVDLTPAGDNRSDLPDLVSAGIVSVEEARAMADLESHGLTKSAGDEPDEASMAERLSRILEEL